MINPHFKIYDLPNCWNRIQVIDSGIYWLSVSDFILKYHNGYLKFQSVMDAKKRGVLDFFFYSQKTFILLTSNTLQYKPYQHKKFNPRVLKNRKRQLTLLTSEFQMNRKEVIANKLYGYTINDFRKKYHSNKITRDAVLWNCQRGHLDFFSYAGVVYVVMTEKTYLWQPRTNKKFIKSLL